MISDRNAYSPLAVAKFFLQQGRGDADLTPMKLIKLVYIAHGWHMAVTNESLIAENAEAWPYGPVVPSVYEHYKTYGKDRIPSQEANHLSTEVKQDDSTTRTLLDIVWNKYGDYDGLQLSTLTHKRGTPWYEVWHNRGGKDQRSVPIPNPLIQGHYKEIISDAMGDEW